MHNRKWHWVLALAGLFMLAKTWAAYSLQPGKPAIPASEPLHMVDGPVSIPASLFSAFV